MAVLISAELLTLRFAMHTLSAVRAFVGGEGIWSKAQKDAAFNLQRYVTSSDEKDYQTFLNFLAVPEGDHLARIELSKPDPDLNRVRQGFIIGKIHPGDIDAMIELLLRFHRVSYLRRAIQAWTDADGFLSEIKVEAETYHGLVQAGHQNNDAAAKTFDRIKALNDQLTNVEGEFSGALGEGSRWLEGLVISILFMAVLMVETIGLTLTFLTSRMISRGLANLNTAAQKIGAGDFAQRLEVHSRDEIGTLTESVNKMGEILQSSYQDLERRVAERTEELSKMATDNERLYQEAKIAAQEREEFFSIASHELRTPLTSQLLQLQMLDRVLKISPDIPEFFRVKQLALKSLSSSLRLTSLLDKLLDLTRIRVGKFEINRERCNLVEVISDVLPTFNSQIHFRPEGPVSGMFDSVRIGQIVTNLVSNAQKYGGHKPISIDVKCVEKRAVLTVKDQGPGIPSSEQARIFGAFERKVHDKSIGGLGLGLYITRQIVEAHGGVISVKSQIGQGAEFTVELPLEA